MTPKEAAIELIKPYIERGDDPEHLRLSFFGSSSDDYRASIGGFIYKDGEGPIKVPNNKILVRSVGEQEVNLTFKYYDIVNCIKNNINQLSLF